MADASVFVMEHVDFKDTYKAGAKDIRNCHTTDQKITFANAFEIADDVLRQAVQSISDLIKNTGFINLDFADVTAVMQNAVKIGINEIGGGSLANAGNRLFSSIEILIWKMKV